MRLLQVCLMLRRLRLAFPELRVQVKYLILRGLLWLLPAQ